MIQAVAIDDEQLALDVLKKYCSNCKNINLLNTFTNPIEGLNFIKKNTVHLVFLDIEMPQLNGLDLAKKLPKNKYIIFTTAFSSFALESYDVNALDYLLKPISPDRFLKAINKVESLLQHQIITSADEKEFILLKINSNLVKIIYSEIFYIESWKDFIKIYIKGSNKMHCVRITMKKIIQLLPTNAFIQIHRCYIVPKKDIIKFNKNQLFISNKTLPIGNNFFDNLTQLATN